MVVAFRAVQEFCGITPSKFNTMDELRLRIQHSILLKVAQMENAERGFSKTLEKKGEEGEEAFFMKEAASEILGATWSRDGTGSLESRPQGYALLRRIVRAPSQS
jgi:hypothetical protein